MKEYAQLTSGDDHAAQAVDAETAEHDKRADDNTQGNLKLER